MRSSILRLLAVTLCAALFSGCGSDGTVVVPNRRPVRMAHFAAQAPNLDLWGWPAGGSARMFFSNVAYGTATSYYLADAIDTRLTVDSTGTRGVIADNLGWAPFGGSHSYTLFLFYHPTLHENLLYLVFDDPPKPGAGKARLRMMDLFQDVSDQVQVLLNGVLYGRVPPDNLQQLYYDVDAGTFAVRIRSDADTTQVYADGTLTAVAGSKYTMVLSGMHSGGPSYRVTVLTDSIPASTAPAWPVEHAWPLAPWIARR